MVGHPQKQHKVLEVELCKYESTLIWNKSFTPPITGVPLSTSALVPATQYLSPSMTADWFYISSLSYISFVVPRSAPRIHTIPRQYHVWEEGRLVPLFWCCRRSKLVWRFLRYGTRRCAIVSVTRWYCNLARLRRRWDVMQCCEQKTQNLGYR